jgi:hypothetical protein
MCCSDQLNPPSNSDVDTHNWDVGFTPMSGHRQPGRSGPKSAMKRHSLPQVRTLLLEVAWGSAREKFAISASVDAAPAAVKAAQSSPVMLASRLTINVARKSLPVSKPPAAIRQFRERGKNEQTMASGCAAMQRKLL